MKKNILFVTILLISTFFGFKMKCRALDKECKYTIFYPFSPGLVSGTTKETEKNYLYSSYTRHLFAYKYGNDNWIKEWEDYNESYSFSNNNNLSSNIASIELVLNKKPQKGYIRFNKENFLYFKDQKNNIKVSGISREEFENFKECPEIVQVKVGKTHVKTKKVDFKIEANNLQNYDIQNIDSFISNFYFEGLNEGEYPFLFIRKDSKLNYIIDAITYINYSYNQYFHQPTTTNAAGENAGEIIEKYLKKYNIKDDLDKINAQYIDNEKGKLETITSLMDDTVKKIKNIDEIDEDLEVLKRFTEVSVEIPFENDNGKGTIYYSYTGLRNILKNYAFKVKLSGASEIYKYLSNNPTEPMDKLNYYSQYGEALYHVLKTIQSNKSTINHIQKSEELLQELEKANQNTNQCNEDRKKIEAFSNGNGSCSDDKLIDILASYECESNKQIGTAYTACMDSKRRTFKNNCNDMKKSANEYLKNNNCDSVSSNVCDMDEIDVLSRQFCLLNNPGIENSGTALDACISSIDASKACNNYINKGNDIKDIINKDKNEKEESLKRSIKNYLIQTYKQQGIDISETDWCNVLFDENKQDGLYKYIRGTLLVINIMGPILVIGLTALDAIKMIASSKEEDNKKFWNHIKIRLICLVLLILIPTIINFLVKLVIEKTCSITL